MYVGRFVMLKSYSLDNDINVISVWNEWARKDLSL